MAVAPPRVKPKLRGVFHELAFFAALGVGIPLALTAEPARHASSAIVFASCVAACFGASALYHRPTWQPRARSWLARLDHAGIYLLIAGTYTPFCLLVLSRGWAVPVLTIIWTGATAAILLKLFWPAPAEARLGGDRPRARLGRGRRVHAAAQAARWPGSCSCSAAVSPTRSARSPTRGAGRIPFPGVLGYHEVFHGLTIVAAGCQYAAIAFYVLPRA